MDSKLRELHDLARRHDSVSMERLEQLLDDPSPDVRALALSVEARIDESAATGRAKSSLADPDGRVRATAARILGEARDASAVSALAERVAKDPAWEVRRGAADALAAIADPAGAPALIGALSDDVEAVRLAAAKGIAATDPRAGIAALRRTLELEPSWQVRVEAARGLAASGDPAAVPALEYARSDPNEFVRLEAERALRGLARGGARPSS